MKNFSFNSNNRTNHQNIKTQNNYSSKTSVDSQTHLQLQITELHNKLEFVIKDTLPNLVKNLLDSKIQNLIEEKTLNDSYLIAKEKTEVTRLTKEEVVKLVKLRGDALIDEKVILKIFPSLVTIR